MEIKFQDEIKTVDLKHKIKIKDLYKKLDLNPEEYLILKDGKLLTHDKYVSPEDSLRIVKVVSGG